MAPVNGDDIPNRISVSVTPRTAGPDGCSGLLSAAVGNARDREDRRIVHYARRLFEFDGTTGWQAAAAQLNALVACAIVLSAHLEFGGAHAVLNRAQELLECTDRGIDQVAAECGLTALMLRRHFARRLGVTPQAYRRRRLTP